MSRLVLTLIVGLLAIANVYAVDYKHDKQYIIYPQLGLSSRNSEILTGLINEHATGKDKVHIYTRSQQSKPTFWLAKLSEAAFELLNHDQRIRDIHVNEIIAEPFDAKGSAENQSVYVTNATGLTPDNASIAMGDALSAVSYRTQPSPEASELRVLSQPKGTDSIKQYKNYVFPIGGSETYIYHAEMGINKDHLDFQNPQRQIEWVYTPLAEFYGQDMENESRVADGHSTCTASKAAGNIYGANRQATLVVVKMPDWSMASIVQILLTISDHIHHNRRQARSVVSISWGTKATISALQATVSYELMLGAVVQLSLEEVILVCAAGNHATEVDEVGKRRFRVDTAPAVLGFGAPRLVVVGNSDNNGKRSSTSQISNAYHQIHAPGVDIKCAKSTSTTGYRYDSGTSFSAPLVAGVIADFLARGQIDFGLSLSEFLYTKASWARSGGEYVIWNGVGKTLNPPAPLNSNTTILHNINTSFSETTGPTNGAFDSTTE